MPLTVGQAVPPRSKTFSEAEIRQGVEALGQGQNIGLGSYDSEEKARSKAQAFNRMVLELKLSETKFASTVFPDPANEGQSIVALLPKAAKVVEPRKKAAKKSR